MDSNSAAIYISLLSLLISIATLYRQRKRLTVTIDDNLYVLNPKTDVRLLDGSLSPLSAEVAFYCTIKIVNPSYINQSFFDLRAFNPKTNANHFIATRRTSFMNIDEPHLVLSPFHDKEVTFIATLPERTYGILPAGSFTCLDVLIYANQHVPLEDGIYISLHTSDTSLSHRSKFSVTNRKIYASHEKFFDITGYQEILSQNQ